MYVTIQAPWQEREEIVDLRDQKQQLNLVNFIDISMKTSEATPAWDKLCPMKTVEPIIYKYSWKTELIPNKKEIILRLFNFLGRANIPDNLANNMHGL